MTKIFQTTALALCAIMANVISAPSFVFAAEAGDTVSVIEDVTAPASPDASAAATPPQPTAVAPVETPPVADITPLPHETVPVVSDSAAPPAPTAPLPAAQPMPLPEAVSGVAQNADPLGNTGVMAKHSGQYYDANALVPDSDLAKAGVSGPQKVDPLYEPGQKYIIVEHGASASSYESQYVAANRALKLGRYAAAMEMFEKLHKKNSRDPRTLMGLAVAQQGAGFVESAAHTYQTLLDIDPNNADAVVNLMGIMKTQYPSVTLQNLMELRDKYPSNPGIPAQIGLVNAEMKNYDDAMRYLEVAASMDPQNPSHVYNMAIITDRKGDARAAIPLYERALQLDSSYGDGAKGLPREQIYDRLATLRRKA